MMAMRNVVLYIVLAKHDNEQSDLIHRIIKEKILQDLPRSLHYWCYDFQDQCFLKKIYASLPVLRIRDIFVRIRIRVHGSVPLTNGFGLDPTLDPDPVILVSDFKMTKKNFKSPLINGFGSESDSGSGSCYLSQ
jgi:hypothetical protein